MTTTETDLLKTRVQSLTCELAALKSENESLKCDVTDENDRRLALIEKYQADLKEMRRIQDERDAAHKACAEMRDILSELSHRMSGHGWGSCGLYQISNAQLFDSDYNHIRNALSSDCGRGYIHRDKVKPLMEALDTAQRHLRSSGLSKEHDTNTKLDLAIALCRELRIGGGE